MLDILFFLYLRFVTRQAKTNFLYFCGPHTVNGDFELPVHQYWAGSVSVRYRIKKSKLFKKTRNKIPNEKERLIARVMELDRDRRKESIPYR